MSEKLLTEGYTFGRKAIDPETLAMLKKGVEALRDEHSFKGGLRVVTELSESISRLVSEDSLQQILESLGSPDALLVRSIVFDKTPDSNWKAAWHQDKGSPKGSNVKSQRNDRESHNRVSS